MGIFARIGQWVKRSPAGQRVERTAWGAVCWVVAIAVIAAFILGMCNIPTFLIIWGLFS